MAVCRHFLLQIHILWFNSLNCTQQIPGQMGHGPAGGLGQPVHRGGRLGPEPVLILNLTVVEQIAWALTLRLSDVKLTFTSD